MIEIPLLNNRLHNYRVKEYEAATLKCGFTTSEIPYLSICAWSTEDGPIFSSHKYQLNKTSIPGRGNQVLCILTVSNVTSDDVGKYYCYCYYNESFWEEFHVPKYTNISSQRGEIMLQLIDKTSKF